MSARIRLFALMSRNREAIAMPDSPTPTPATAVSNGSPAATSDPNVMTRTSAATSTPMTSVAPVSGLARSASPPASTVNPAARPASSPCSSAARSPAVSWVLCTA